MEFGKDKSLVAHTFGLDQPVDFLDEETMLKALAQKIAQMLDHEPDLLFSTLYRLDVLEHKIQNVLNNPSIPNDAGLAQLVIDRQKEKIETRRKYQSNQSDWIDDFDI
jgi:hypothetical protein